MYYQSGREKKKNKNQPGSRKRGDKSRDLESAQLPARDRNVSGSWQPRPDEETGWRHSKPGRESSIDGKEGERHSPRKTLTPGQCAGLPTLFSKAGDHRSSRTWEYFMRGALTCWRSSKEVTAEAAGSRSQHPCAPKRPGARFD